MSYRDFLKTKVEVAPVSGFDVDISEISSCLKPHQKAAVQWAVKGGRRALLDISKLKKKQV